MEFLASRKSLLAAGFLGCMGLWVILLVGQHLTATRRISESKAAGLASVSGGFNPLGQWIYRKQLAAMNAGVREGTLEFADAGPETSRRVVNKAALRLRVKDVAGFLRDGSVLAQQLGGYVVNSNQTSAGRGAQGTLVLAVPAGQFGVALERIRTLALSVDDLKTQATDVSKQYVDFEATLRSYRAEEAQYLSILRQAKKVPDVITVTERLLDVRRRIESTEGEFRYLQHEVALSTISIDFYIEVPPMVTRWQASTSFREGWDSMTSGLATFADGAIYLLFQLPLLGLWSLVLWSGAISAWRILRWVKRQWLSRPNEQQVQV